LIKIFSIQKVVKPKTNDQAKYLPIHKEAVRKSPRIVSARPRARCFDWTIHRAAGILIARWGHL
jgi:hypothetical protein